jgi:hypothetical protein
MITVLLTSKVTAALPDKDEWLLTYLLELGITSIGLCS